MEWLNDTIKCLLQRSVQKEPRKWDLVLVPLMFALRDKPQVSTQFMPFELIFGQKP